MPKNTNSKKASAVLEDEETLTGDQSETTAGADKGGADVKSTQGRVEDEGVRIAPKKPKPLVEKMTLPEQPKIADKNTVSALGADQKKMRTFLEGQQKFPIMIPLEPGESMGTKKQMWLNGYYLEVPKGEMVMVPEEVFNVLQRGMNLVNMAGRNMLLSRSDDVEDALG